MGGGWQEAIPSAAHPSLPAPRTEVADLRAAGVHVVSDFVTGGHDFETWDPLFVKFLEDVAFKPLPTKATGPRTAAVPKANQSAFEMARASDGVAPYVGQPSPFPVDSTLKSRPSGQQIWFLGCASPFCTGLESQVNDAGAAMGVTITDDVINNASDPVAVGAEFDKAVAAKPAAVIVSSIDAGLWTTQLAELKAEGTKVVTVAVNDAAANGITASQEGSSWATLTGKLLADYTEADISCVPGETADCVPVHAVYFDMSQLGFTGPITSGFDSELKAVCYLCTGAYDDLPISDIGPNRANADVVAYLKAHPSDNLAVFPANEVAGIELQSALKAAGITDVKILGLNPGSDNLGMIQDGDEVAGLGEDSSTEGWTLLDIAAREIAGQALTAQELSGDGVMEFLTPASFTDAGANGLTETDGTWSWLPYPHYAREFEKYWGVS